MAAITGICGTHFPTMALFFRHLARCPRCQMAQSISIMHDKAIEAEKETTMPVSEPEPQPVHYHGNDATVAFPGTSCNQCSPFDGLAGRAAYADRFIAATQAQTEHFLAPSPADYMACDRTINEERRLLRAEYITLPVPELIRRLREAGRYVEGLYGRERSDLIHELVDTVCPRGWLDRRLKEVL